MEDEFEAAQLLPFAYTLFACLLTLGFAYSFKVLSNIAAKLQADDPEEEDEEEEEIRTNDTDK